MRLEQYGVIAYRLGSEGMLEVMLITSRDTRRWVVPRGNAMKDKAPHEAATVEAWEEAGLIGSVGSQAIGVYPYDKRRKDGSTIPAIVHLYPMRVASQSAKWPERSERETRWFSLAEAASRVDEPELRQLLLDFVPPPAL